MQKSLWMAIAATALLGACDIIKEKTAAVSNDINVKGHWLVTESQHSSDLTKIIENESMVLTFKDGKAAFSPTDSLKGRAVFATISRCTSGPRGYHTDKFDIVFEVIPDCVEKRVSVKQLDSDHLRFSDPDNSDIVRTFVRIDDAKYEALVKQSDRQP